MPQANRKIAFIYDFDGTLIDDDSLDPFIVDELGFKSPQDFWKKSNSFAKRNELDRIAAFMLMLSSECYRQEKRLDKKRLQQIGREVIMRDGLLPVGKDPGWFANVNTLAKKHKLAAEHYVITSGIAEIVEACPIARELEMVFGSRLHYSRELGQPVWPAQVVNHTTKTQYLFRINKGAFDLSDDNKVNSFMEPASRPMPFDHMVFVGDGYTDIPCFSLIKQNGGCAIAMLKGKELTHDCIEQMQTLVNDNRVDAISLTRSFAWDSTMMRMAERIIKKLAKKHGK